MIVGESLVCYQLIKSRELMTRDRTQGVLLLHPGPVAVGGEFPWKKLWALKCPGKIKHHLWRLTNNSLAVRKELVQRGMEMDTKCVLCNRLDEDGAHLFFKCKGAVKVWRALGMEQHRCILERKSSASDAMKYILGTQEREQMIIVTFLWLWWLERNRV